MNQAKRIEILTRLREQNPHPTTELEYNSPFELLIAVILSAQATDKGVNKATAKLFPVANTPQAILDLGLEGLKEYIKTIGLYNSKAENIIKTCRDLVEKHNGEVPENREALEALAGVGRKTANVVRGNWYHIPSVVVDTHVKRVSNLLGLTKNEDPVKIEFDLMQLVPKDKWIDINTQMIAHGRKICIARRPKCQECFLLPYCTGGKALEKEKKKKEKKA